MNSDELAKTLDTLKEINMLSHLNNEEIDSIYYEAKQGEFSRSRLIYALPDVVYGLKLRYKRYVKFYYKKYSTNKVIS